MTLLGQIETKKNGLKSFWRAGFESGPKVSAEVQAK